MNGHCYCSCSPIVKTIDQMNNKTRSRQLNQKCIKISYNKCTLVFNLEPLSKHRRDWFKDYSPQFADINVSIDRWKNIHDKCRVIPIVSKDKHAACVLIDGMACVVHTVCEHRVRTSVLKCKVLCKSSVCLQTSVSLLN